MNFTKFKLKGLLSIAMLVGILTTSMGIESLAFSKDSIKLSDKQEIGRASCRERV